MGGGKGLNRYKLLADVVALCASILVYQCRSTISDFPNWVEVLEKRVLNVRRKAVEALLTSEVVECRA